MSYKDKLNHIRPHGENNAAVSRISLLSTFNFEEELYLCTFISGHKYSFHSLHTMHGKENVINSTSKSGHVCSH